MTWKEFELWDFIDMVNRNHGVLCWVYFKDGMMKVKIHDGHIAESVSGEWMSKIGGVYAKNLQKRWLRLRSDYGFAAPAILPF